MVRVISLLFEIMSAIVCLFWLCGEKIKVTYKMLCMMAIHIGLFTICYYIGYGNLASLFVYAIIIGYVVIEFRIRLGQALVKIIIMVLLCMAIQTIMVLLFELVSPGITRTAWGYICVNLLLLLTVYFLYKKVNVQGIITYVKGESKTAAILLTGIFCFVAFYFLSAKRNQSISGIDYLLFFVMAIVIIFLIGTWEKYRIQMKQKEIEMEVHEIYAESYQKLIDEIRVRQHEFDNHLQAIIDQQFTCNTYEELTCAQSEYIQAINYDNRFNKLLRQGNSVYIGFLYGKFVSMEEQGINVHYKISIGQLQCDMPVHKIIEITSDLLNNACEALILPTDIPQPVYLQLEETKKDIILEIRNVGEPLSPDFIGECFKKGYSKKGSNRGLGLYNVKNIANQYNADVQFQNIIINHHNWISFTVTIPKPIRGGDRLW